MDHRPGIGLYEVSFSGGPGSLRKGRIDRVGIIGGDSLCWLLILRPSEFYLLLRFIEQKDVFLEDPVADPPVGAIREDCFVSACVKDSFFFETVEQSSVRMVQDVIQDAVVVSEDVHEDLRVAACLCFADVQFLLDGFCQGL